MTIGAIKDTVAAYFQEATSYFTIGGTDLLLVALNSSRKKAELVHDFEASKVVVDLVVDDVAGGDLTDAVLTGTDDGVRIKSVIQAGVVLDGHVKPVRFTTTTSLDKERLDRSVTRWDHWDEDCRYPSDAQFRRWNSGGLKVLQFGGKLFKYPFGTAGESSTLTLQVYKWFDEYEGEDAADMEDVFTQHGYDYLKWATIVEVNHLAKAFVSRQEGNLAPPTAMADAALSALISWDEYVIEGGRSYGA